MTDVEATIDKIRQAMMKRGASGIKGIGRAFRVFDNDRNHKLAHDEIQKGLMDFGVNLSDSEMKIAMKFMDPNEDGSISFDDFCQVLRPPMSKCRIDLLEKAYGKMDATGDGIVTVADLKGVYNVDDHPKLKSGDWTADQCLQEFLKKFDKNGDATVTKEEFLWHYAGVSASIDNDAYFDLMIRNSWKL